MTTVTVLNGDRTIGGTQIVVEDGGYRLLFDCGLAYDPATDPFGRVYRRPASHMHDLLALGLTPRIPGLYRDAPIDPNAEATGPLAVALSHAHLDHTHLVGFVDPAVPIYASPATTRIVEVFSALGVMAAPVERDLTAVEPDSSVQLGPMRLRFVPVDHDLCGACGMLIETSDGVIAYSGDLRLHGGAPERTLSFSQAARRAGAGLLILEGTRLWPAPPPEAAPTPVLRERVEADVVPDIVANLGQAEGQLAVILQSAENGERVEALADAVSRNGRLYVMDLEGLALVYAALGRPLRSPHAVYLPGAVQNRLARGETLTIPESQALATAPQVLEAVEIRRAPGDFLLRLAYHSFADLIDLLPAERGGIILTSNGSPLGRFDPAWVQLEWWADAMGMRLVDAACTGHAAPRDLALLAAHAGAPTVMAIHSRHPELMPIPPERLLLPQRGVPYRVSALVDQADGG